MDWRQHLDIETPEHVVLDYELAGLASRALAAMLDTLLLGLLLLGLSVAAAFLPISEAAAGVLFLVGMFLIPWGYFTLFEAYREGQTPGKRRLGLRVVHDTGHAVTLGGAAVRNLLRVVDFLPPPYLLGGLLVAIHPRAKRLGDLVAGTVVVRDRPEEQARPAAVTAVDLLTAPALGEAEWALLSRYRDRAREMEPAVRERLGTQVAERLASHLDPAAGDPVLALEGLYRAESARRRGGLVGSTRRGADRFAATKRARWDEFGALAARVARGGLDRLGPDELPDFAARYREVAADLARARTYHADAATLARLERLVAAGHNALYRRERTTLGRTGVFLFRECPAAVIASRWYVLLAAAVFLAPGFAGYAVLREQPALAMDILPDVMLDRAERGAAAAGQGLGYFQAPPGERPLVASGIITNNLGVAFRCFAGGVLGGVGSLVLLGYNGLLIGAASGHFANRGVLGYLWTFVAGHGALELLAIWVAGAAGFLLGRSVIAPGDLSRGDALVLAGRTGIRLVTAAGLMLLLAGLIEGFISASGVPLGFRVGASVGSLLVTALYLAGGACAFFHKPVVFPRSWPRERS